MMDVVDRVTTGGDGNGKPTGIGGRFLLFLYSHVCTTESLGQKW